MMQFGTQTVSLFFLINFHRNISSSNSIATIVVGLELDECKKNYAILLTILNTLPIQRFPSKNFKYLDLLSTFQSVFTPFAYLYEANFECMCWCNHLAFIILNEHKLNTKNTFLNWIVVHFFETTKFIEHHKIQ